MEYLDDIYECALQVIIFFEKCRAWLGVLLYLFAYIIYWIGQK